MTYNVENLFDMIDNGREYVIYKPFKNNWNYENLNIKISNISSVIHAANPDILALCEIENLNIGRTLQKELNKHNSQYNYIAASDIPYFTSTCQVILSRFPVISSITHIIDINETNYSRNILETDIAIYNRVFKIFVIHWSSKHHLESKRLKEAEILKKRINELPAGTDYIITGDLNSNYNECETFYTEGLDDTQHCTAINHVLKTVVSAPGQFTRYVTKKFLIQNPDSYYHYDLWLELPEYKRFSYKYKGQFCTLDHILTPGSMYDLTGISYVNNSFSVFYWDGRLLYNGIPLRWDIRYNSKGRFHSGKGFSDHLPIIAWFKTGEFEHSDTEFSDSQESKNSAQLKKGTISGFETGIEGWIPLQASINLFRDTVNPAQGKYCLKIEGITKKNSGTARICFPIKNHDAEEKGSLKFVIYGKGYFTFRTRVDNSSWFYYTGHKFCKVRKSNRYQYNIFSDWTPIMLPVHGKMDKARSFEIEIQSALNKKLCIWLDKMQFTGTIKEN
jgi:endonuclease/exonuclease/phosphatase family metal-dependent hydrolase